MTRILRMKADKDRLPWHMRTVVDLSKHRISERDFCPISERFRNLTEVFRPFPLALLSRRTMPVGGELVGGEL